MKPIDYEQSTAVVLAWCHEFYNTNRRHSSAAMMTPIDYEQSTASPAAPRPSATRRRPDGNANPAE